MRMKLLAGILALALPALLVAACGRKGADDHAQHGTARTATKYTCPMHPNYVSDKPGECPICGMNLVPVEHEGHEEHGGGQAAAPQVEGLASVKISPEKRELIGLRTVTAEWKDISRKVTTTGQVAYDPDLYYAEQEYIMSLKTLDQSQEGLGRETAESMVAASRTRLKLLGLSDIQIEALGRARAPDRSLLMAGGSGRIWIYAAVYENDLPLVRAGQTATISAPSVVTDAFVGTVVAVDPVFDPATRSVRARITADNPGGILKPQAYVTVTINVPLGSNLVVPADAVMDTGTRQVAFVDKGEDVLEPREVMVRYRTGEYAVIASGLSAGEKVVTQANFLIDSESQLRSTMQKSAQSGGHQH